MAGNTKATYLIKDRNGSGEEVEMEVLDNGSVRYIYQRAGDEARTPLLWREGNELCRRALPGGTLSPDGAVFRTVDRKPVDKYVNAVAWVVYLLLCGAGAWLLSNAVMAALKAGGLA